jgi:hypothetical protein
MVINAARLGDLFKTDPIRLLDCSEDEWLIRMACAKVIANDREREAKEQERAQRLR